MTSPVTYSLTDAIATLAMDDGKANAMSAALNAGLDRRRIERHLAEARLLPGKTLETFEFEALPMISKAQVMAVAAGDGWLDQGANLLLFGPPDRASYCSPRYVIGT